MISNFRTQLRRYFLRSLWHREIRPGDTSLDNVLACDLIMLGGMAGEW